MAIQYSRWERRDGADRDALGRAALAACRATRTDTSRSRFYWASADEIVILAEAPETRDFFREPTAEGAAAYFALSDLARRVDYQLWAEAGRGEQTWRLAEQAKLAGARR